MARDNTLKFTHISVAGTDAILRSTHLVQKTKFYLNVECLGKRLGSRVGLFTSATCLSRLQKAATSPLQPHGNHHPPPHPKHAT